MTEGALVAVTVRNEILADQNECVYGTFDTDFHYYLLSLFVVCNNVFFYFTPAKAVFQSPNVTMHKPIWHILRNGLQFYKKKRNLHCNVNKKNTTRVT